MSRRPASLPLRSLAAWTLLCVVLAVLCPCDTAAAADSLSRDQQLQILQEAQRDYDRGIALVRSNPAAAADAFRSAVRRFQLLVDEGLVNGKLYFNLANAHLQAGQLGRAILNYRRAEALIPGDPRLESNLAYARSMRRSPVAPSGRRALLSALLSWHKSLPLTARLWIFAAAYAAFWILLIVRLFRARARWLLAAAACAAVSLAAAASVAADTVFSNRAPQGVLLLDDVVLRKGNGLGFAPQFEQPIHRGEEFRLIERRADWLNVELRNGKTGWLPAHSAELVRPLSPSARS